MKATILLDDLTVIYEGEVHEVIEAVEAFFDDREGESQRDCPDCKHFETRLGGPPCSKCRDGDKFEPKPEAQEFDDNHLICGSCSRKEAPPFAPGDLCGCGGMFQKRRGFKPNYRVHPAEMIRECVDMKGGIDHPMSVFLWHAFGPSPAFWVKLWENYEAARGANEPY